MDKDLHNHLSNLNSGMTQETPNKTRRASSDESMRDGLNNLSMTNINRVNGNNSNVGQPPRLSAFTDSTHSSHNANTSQISSNNNFNGNTDTLRSAGPNGNNNMPKLNFIGPISCLAQNPNGVSNDLNTQGAQGFANNNSSIINTTLLGSSITHQLARQFNNQVVDSSPSSNSHSDQLIYNSLNNQNPTDLLFSGKFFENYFNEANSNSPISTSPMSISTPTKSEEIHSNGNNSTYNIPSSSSSYSTINHSGDYFGYSNILGNFDSIPPGSITTIDRSNHGISENTVNSNTLSNNNNVGMNDSVAYGDDTIFYNIPQSFSNNVTFDNNIDSHGNINYVPISTEFAMNQSEFVEQLDPLNIHDANNPLFYSGSLLQRHFQERMNNNASNELVVAVPPNNVRNLSGTTSMNNIPNDQQNNYFNFNNNSHAMFEINQLNNLSMLNDSDNCISALINSSAFSHIATNGNYPSHNNGHSGPNRNRARGNAPQQRRPANGRSRRRADADDPQSNLRRHNHNMLERKRRKELRDNFNKLVTLLPELRGTAVNRLSKVKILVAVTDYVRSLDVSRQHLENLENDRKRILQELGEKVHYLSSTNRINLDNKMQ